MPVQIANPEQPHIQAQFDQGLRAGLACLPGPGPSALLSAVSGGPDSLALALLAEGWAARAGCLHSAVIIDHGLRPAAAQEAAETARQLGRRQIAWRIEKLAGPPPSSGVQEWARRQRRQLLAAIAREQGAVVLTGHQAADQAETIAMRLAKGSGLAGLAGMGVASWADGALFVRPLLQAGRAEIEGFCHSAGLRPVRDPSNQDRRFERVRTRQLLAACPELAPQLHRLGRVSQHLQAGLDAGLAEFLAHSLDWRPPLEARLPLAAFLDLPDRAAQRLLSLMLPVIGGRDHPPAMQAVTSLLAGLRTGRAATLSGCLVQPLGSELRLMAEAGRQPPMLPMPAAASAVFDGRWLVSSAHPVRWTILGQAGYDALDRKSAFFDQLRVWSAPARRCFPVALPLDAGATGPQIYPEFVSQLCGPAHSAMPDGKPAAVQASPLPRGDNPFRLETGSQTGDNPPRP